MAILSNFDTAIEATTTALNSAGSAAQENSAYMSSLEAQTSKVRATFQDLANNVISNELVGSLLTLADVFLQFVNTPIGTFATQVVLLTGAISGLISVLKAMNIASVVASQFSNLAQMVKNLMFVMSGASGPLVATSGIMGAFIPIALGVSAAIAGIVAVLPYASDWYKEFTNDVYYANDKLEENNNKLETNKERLEALYNVPVANRTAAIWEEIEALEEENAELEKNIEYWTQKGIQGTLDDLRQGAYETQAYIVKGYDSPFTEWVTSEEEAIKRLKEWGYEYDNLGDKIEDFGFTLEELGQSVYVDDETYLKKLINAQQKLQEKVASGTELTGEEAEQYSKNNSILEERLDIYETNIEQGGKLNNVEESSLPIIKDLTSNYQNYIDTLYDADETLDLLAQGFSLNEGQVNDLIATYPELSDVISENNGVWELNQEALFNVAAQGNETARAMIEAQIKTTEQTITSIQQRIKAYQAELRALQSLGGAKESSAWMSPILQDLTGNQIFEYDKSPFQVLPGLNTAQIAKISDSISADNATLKESQSLLDSLLAQVESWDPEVVDYTPSPKKTETKEKEEEVDIIEEQSKAFDEQNAIMEHNIYLREQQGASEEELIKLNQQYQNELHKQAEWYRGQGLSDTSEYIRDTQKQWWELQETIEGYEGDITENARDNFDSRLQMYDDYISDRNDLDDWGADSEIKTYQRMLAWMDEQYAQGLIDYEYYVEQRAEKAHELAVLEKEAEEQAFEDARNAFDEKLNLSENYIQDRNDLGDWGADNEIAAYERVLAWMDKDYADGLIDYEYYWEKRSEIQKKKKLAEKAEEERLFQERRDIFDEGLEEYEQYIQDRNDFNDWGVDNEIAAYQRMIDWMDEQYAQGLIDYEYYLDARHEATKKAALAEKEAWEQAKQDEIEDMERTQEAYEILFSWVADKAQEEIDALEAQKEEINERYQAQIDALKAVNEELDDQIAKEEALDKLARARQTKVMVYKDGHFQYIEDIDQVSEAQANLEKIERDEVLQKELDNLEELRDKELASIDEQIEGWEDYKKAWESVVSDYQEEQDKLLVEQELGIKLEDENWQTRIGNLENFISEYRSLLQELTRIQEELNEGYDIDLGEYGNAGGVGGSTGITPGTGSLAGTEYNAWAWVPGAGYVPVQVENGHTVQTGLPEGTIIYGDAGAWEITGGVGGELGYTSEYVGETPSNIWTPGKETTSSGSSSSGSSSIGSNQGGGRPSSSDDSYTNEPPLPSSSGGSSSGSYTGTSSNGVDYTIGSDKGKDFVDNAPAGSTMTGGDGSTWTKNPDGSTTINRGDDTWTVSAHALGTLSASGGLSLVGENGPELRVINSGDGIIPADITKNLWNWGNITPKSMLNNIISGLRTAGQNVGITIQNFSPNLPNVKDGEGFANYMKNNFWREAIQFAKSN